MIFQISNLRGMSMRSTNQGARQDRASTSAENTQASSQNAPQSLRDRRASAGFTDVTIVPSSLVVTAKDQATAP
jgi:hypothetical protein